MSARPDPDYEAYQLVVPMMDFMVRWSIYSASSREKARNWLGRAGLENPEAAALVDFLDALDEAAG